MGAGAILFIVLVVILALALGVFAHPLFFLLLLALIALLFV